MIELSVVIPSRDAGNRLRACLDALARQRGVDGAFEVIVVDDGSEPPVDPRLALGFDRFSLTVVRRELSGGPGAARNDGWRVAKGRVCLFLDDDVVVGPDVVAGHLAAHRAGAQAGIAVIGIGRMTARIERVGDWLARRYGEAWNANVAELHAGRPLAVGDCYSGNLSIPTEALRTSTGFDTGFRRSEDIELAARLVESGLRLAYVPAESEHRERKSGHTLLIDSRQTGEMAARLVERHPFLLAETTLGAFVVYGPRQLTARRLAVALRLPAELLRRLTSPLGSRWHGRTAMAFLLHVAYWHGVRSAVRPEQFSAMTAGTAILMYHAFDQAGARASRYVLPIDRFEAQLVGLLRRGYRPIRLSTYLELRRLYRFPPARSFVVTIDDAYVEVETLVAPVLRRLGVPATILAVDEAIGGVNRWDRTGPLSDRPILDADALDRLRGDGFEIAVHSATHVPLTGMSAGQLTDEVQGAADRLSARFGPLVPAFAYPFGLADDASRSAVADAGMVGLGIGPALACPLSSSLELPRIEIRGSDSPARVALAAWTGTTRGLFRR